MTFTSESQYLMHLICCAINNSAPEEKPEHLSFEKVYEIGVEHEVANIAFYSVEKLCSKPSPELYAEWKAKRDIAISRDINQAFARSEIIELFSEKGIESIELQGTEIKKLYPSSEYRTMSDVDFIIRSKDLIYAKDILEELGYNCKTVDDEEVDGFRSPNICVEVHTDYFTKNSEYSGILPHPFSVGDDKINVFYAYNIFHVAKHYFGRGCGIRRILDVYFLNKTYKDVIDKKYVDSLFQKANIVEFVDKISELADCWMNGQETPENLKSMENYIFFSNVHGKEEILMENYLKKKFGKGKRFLKVKYFLRRIFPAKAEMCQKYPAVEKCILLYPFCCFHRSITTILDSRKRKIVMEDAKNVVLSNPDREN